MTTKKKTVKSTPMTKIKYVDKVVEVPQSYHPDTERYLQSIQKECDLNKTELIEAILFESEINSRRFGIFSIASKMHNFHLRIVRERG